MQQLPVSDVMRECSFAVVAETMRLRDAAEILVTHNYPVLVVEDESGRMIGLIPEAAVIRLLMATTSRDETVSSILFKKRKNIHNFTYRKSSYRKIRRRPRYCKGTRTNNRI